jgi:hypothetical protein
MKTTVLVEGDSDRLAIEALARRWDRDLEAEGTTVVSMGGATNIGSFLKRFAGSKVAGLCDAAEEGEFRCEIERAGLGAELDRAGMEMLGFFVCVEDLEDELIRALGADAVERVIHARGELESFRTFQKQPAWRGRPAERQLRRFMGSADSRKVRYARLLVEALPLERVPRPLVQVLTAV